MHRPDPKSQSFSSVLFYIYIAFELKFRSIVFELFFYTMRGKKSHTPVVHFIHSSLKHNRSFSMPTSCLERKEKMGKKSWTTGLI